MPSRADKQRCRPPFLSLCLLQGMGRRQALVGALRREDAAVKEVKRLEAELEGMRGLLKVGGRAVCGGRWAGSWAHWSPAYCE